MESSFSGNIFKTSINVGLLIKLKFKFELGYFQLN